MLMNVSSRCVAKTRCYYMVANSSGQLYLSKKKEKQQHTNNHEGENSSTGLFIQNIQAYGIELKGNSKHSQFSLSEAMHILISRPLAKLFQSLDSDFTFSFQYEQSLSK